MTTYVCANVVRSSFGTNMIQTRQAARVVALISIVLLFAAAIIVASTDSSVSAPVAVPVVFLATVVFHFYGQIVPREYGLAPVPLLVPRFERPPPSFLI